MSRIAVGVIGHKTRRHPITQSQSSRSECSHETIQITCPANHLRTANGRKERILKPIRNKNGTQQRLLEAAGEVFADRGFRDATIREICRNAGSNHAAVNYYFGTKEQLYIEVIRHVFQSGQSQSRLEWEAGTPPELKLRDYMQWLIFAGSRHAPRPTWHVRLTVREMSAPTKACAGLIEKYIRGRYELLDSILADILPAGMPSEDRLFTTLFILGQAEHFGLLRTLASLLVNEQDYPDFDARRLADFITRISLTALAGENSLQATDLLHPLAEADKPFV